MLDSGDTLFLSQHWGVRGSIPASLGKNIPFEDSKYTYFSDFIYFIFYREGY